MGDELKGFRLSSAQRRGPGPSLVVIGAAAALVIALLLIIFHGGDEEPAPEPFPVQAATATPPPTPSAQIVEQSSEWVTATSPTETPTPVPPIPQLPTAVSRGPRQPTPTPRISECVTFRWNAMQVFSPSAQVMVEVRSVNRCDRDIEALELWFEITGWREGDLIQSVRGHPFDPLRRRRSVITTIGLPGSIDWYDEITVEIVD